MNTVKSLFILLLLLSVTAESSAQRPRRGVKSPTAPKSITTQPVAPAEAVSPPETAIAPPHAPVPLAIVNGQTITSAEINPAVRDEVDGLEGRLAEARRQILEMQVNTLLLETEAAKRRMTSQQLYTVEVANRITEPSAAEINNFIEVNRDQIDQSDPTATRPKVIAFLKSAREANLSEALVKRLRASYPIVNVPAANGASLPPTSVIVTVGGRPITAGMINERVKPIAYKLQLNTYNLAKQALDLTINDLLLLAEANRRSVAPEDIVRTEISEKVRTPSEAEISKFYEDNKAKIPTPFAEAKIQIASYLQDQDRQRLERALSEKLRAGANIRFLISEPPLPSQAISVDDDPVRGDANAPVTIVEFTDFQCPSCANLQPILEEALKSYGNKVRLVVRDFPLSRHENARKAAEAANAANAQGKFFEYTALLFKRQDALDLTSLKKYASELGLNRARFDAALDSGQYAAEVKHDIADGELYGIDSTPAVFVNGVALTEMTIEALRALIDQRLASVNSAPKVSTN
jgi:protein-disulfide isomerase